jgi:hypothetical protein
MGSWSDLPPLLRAGVGVLFIVLAVLGFFAHLTMRVYVPFGALGLVMVLFCKAGHDDSGYNF